MFRPIRAAAVVFAAACMPPPAAAHDHWINRGDYVDPRSGVHCCGPNDCFALPASDIEATPGGYRIRSTGELVPYREVLPSEDASFWRCKKFDGSRRCFFAPASGS